jgi:hypothetical protein
MALHPLCTCICDFLLFGALRGHEVCFFLVDAFGGVSKYFRTASSIKYDRESILPLSARRSILSKVLIGNVAEMLAFRFDLG